MSGGNELFLPLLAGACIFGIASGLAILRGARLPRSLGWVAIVMGIAAVIPPASVPALFFAVMVWSIVVSILMYVRGGAHTAVSQPASRTLRVDPV